MNVLLADDMQSVVNGMEKGINWEELGVSAIYKAYNVYEAKVLLNNLDIDILMTDVEMPGENGLDLVAWIRERNLDIECIILSSHANFDYAQRAIRVNSFQYILLPCSYSEIEAVLKKAIESLQQHREKARLYKYGKMFTDNDWFDAILFEKCLDESMNKEAIGKLQAIYNVDTDSGGYLCRLSISPTATILDQCETKLLQFVFHNILTELAQTHQRNVFVHQRERNTYICFFYSAADSAPDHLSFQSELDEMKEIFSRTLRIETNIQYLYCENFEKIAGVYRQMERMATATFEEECLSDEDAKENDVISEVVEYVRHHTNQDIKRSDLAELVHLNIDYLARIFKKETGTTLNDFIIEEKMKVAKNLLRTTRLPVSLIATKVGYSNFSYFTKLYKKHYGKTPMEEREGK